MLMKNRYIFFLGSHPALSAAEAWQVLENTSYRPQLVAVNNRFLTVETQQPLADDLIDRLGGTDRVAQVLGEGDQPSTAAEIGSLLGWAGKAAKVTVGVSSVGMPQRYGSRLAVQLKSWARGQNISLRFVLPGGQREQLNAAQVEFNKLTERPHAEITIMAHDGVFWACRTVQVQDIAAYERRDTQRPSRQAKVGMLPPKLAQIMLNLALTRLPGADPAVVLDPFCGAGTVLQEGWLMDQRMVGSDASKKMIAASEQNLAWLAEQFTVDQEIQPRLRQHDVREAFAAGFADDVDAVVTEPHLGAPLSTPLPAEKLAERMDALGDLYLAFFATIRPIFAENGFALVALPAWRRRRGSASWELFPTGWLDAVEEIGYSKCQLIPEELAAVFSPTERVTALYARPDALVGRELTLWKRAG